MVTRYIEEKRGAWAETTLRNSERQLTNVAKHLDGEPATLWAELDKRDMAPYSRITLWTVVTNFWGWMQDEGMVTGNPYKKWREKYANRFDVSRAYQPKYPAMGFEEARARIQAMPDPAMQEKALQLLMGGLRYTESFTVSEAGTVVGKGGKVRDVFVEPCKRTIHGGYQAFHRALKRHTGLTPHQLRKILATEAANRGMSARDLCATFGWSSFQTAMNYIAPKEKAQRAAQLQTITQGAKDEREEKDSVSA